MSARPSPLDQTLAMPQRNRVCTCSHLRHRHYNTKSSPAGPCRECGCRAFNAEPVCACDHGLKAHGPAADNCRNCHYGTRCKQFRPVAQKEAV